MGLRYRWRSVVVTVETRLDRLLLNLN